MYKEVKGRGEKRRLKETKGLRLEAQPTEGPREAKTPKTNRKQEKDLKDRMNRRKQKRIRK